MSENTGLLADQTLFMAEPPPNSRASFEMLFTQAPPLRKHADANTSLIWHLTFL